MEGKMATHEFTFIVTDVELSENEQARISQAVAQAAAFALADITPPDALTVPIARNIWWRGIPATEIFSELQKQAVQKTGFQARPGQ
jgi:hypothetical protein